VKTLYIAPGAPWENGYVESFNGKLRDELLAREVFDTLLEAKVLIERWRRLYNSVRPHSSLGYRPRSRAAAGPEPCPDPLEPGNSLARHESNCGHFAHGGQHRIAVLLPFRFGEVFVRPDARMKPAGIVVFRRVPPAGDDLLGHPATVLRDGREPGGSPAAICPARYASWILLAT